MRSFSNFSAYDFQSFVAALLGAELGIAFEVFGPGADGGVDLRHIREDGSVDVVQCKQMQGSTVAAVEAAARREVPRLRAIAEPVASYRFVTSRRLTPDAKQRIAGVFAEWMPSDDHVVGGDDVERLLDAHERVEREQVKLWLPSAAQLDARVNAATWARSRRLRRDIEATLPRYVETGIFATARDRLRTERALVVSGPPGVGKTTLARMLVADAVRDGYEPVEISREMDEANAVVREGELQVFCYDDFLGQTFLHDRLTKNEDHRIAEFIRYARSSPTTLFVMTTREHILRQATQRYENLARAGLPLARLLVELRGYSRHERARIFYNHVWHSPALEPATKRSLAGPQAWRPIVDHRNFNPRVIEYVTGFAAYALTDDDQNDYARFVRETLDDPTIVWDRALRDQLDDDQRLVLLAAVLYGLVTVEELRDAYVDLLGAEPERPDVFRDALEVLLDTFLTTVEINGELHVLVGDPSITDTVVRFLYRNPRVATRAADAVMSFDAVKFLGDLLRADEERGFPARDRASLAGAVARGYDRTWRIPSRFSDIEDRLQHALGLTPDVPELRTPMAPWLVVAREEFAASCLSRSVLFTWVTSDVVISLDRAGLLTPEVAAAFADRVAAVPEQEWDFSFYEAVGDACAGAPGCLPDDLVSRVRAGLVAYVDRAVTGSDVFPATDIDHYVEVGRDLGVELDAETLRRAVDAKDEADRQARVGAGQSPPSFEPSLTALRNHAATAALFATLAEIE